MRKVLAVYLLLAFVAMSAPVAGKLGDFKNDVEKEEKENRSGSDDKHGGGSDMSAHGSDSGDDSCSGACVDAACTFAGQIMYALWASHNFSLCYARFPYDSALGGSFVSYRAVSPPDNPDNAFVEVKPVESPVLPVENPPGTRSWYYTLESTGQYAFDEGWAYAGRISGKFWRFFGPEFSIRLFHDGDDTLVMYQPGINISLFQHSYFSADSYIQASIMRGIMSMAGVSYGLVLSSYPVKPVTLMFRVGGISYEYIDFLDLEGRMGLVFGRVEVFAGYQHIQAKYAGLGGPLAGVRIFL